eukprot:TRINITY_DN2938_c0_g1_i4.p1 TRINITY_DN2938_c0_g1~~TRINITY_DN2938_c0_g1_i4.p1  ORF type:complete len:484 (-),score=130.44 TRINITY_DN2938_c0_g1_i4:13-1464(-)
MNADQYKEIGNTKYKAGQYREAVALYTKAIELDGGKTPSYFTNRAAAYFMLNNMESAIEDCKAATSLDPNLMKAYQRAAKCCLQLGDLQECRKQNFEVLRLDPKEQVALEDLKTVDRVEKEIKIARELLQKSEWHKALAHVEIALKFASLSDAVKLLKARALLGLNKPQEVITLTSDIIRNDANSAEALYLRGLALYQTNNVPAALKMLQSALRSDPDNMDFRTAYKRAQTFEAKKKEGNDAFSAGNYEEAINIYSECLQLEPNTSSLSSTLYCNRAAAYLKLGKHQEAIDDCTKTIEIDPNYEKAYLRRAAASMKMEKWDDAIRDYEKASQMNEDGEADHLLREAKLEKKKSLRKDYYKILDIPKDADEYQIKKAYKKGALKWHPDKNNETPEAHEKADQMFKDIGEAYTVLSDPTKKRRYDSGDDLEDMESGHGMSSADFSSMFSHVFSGGGGMGGGFGGGFGGMPGGMPRGRRGGGGFPF